jgi:hypothetical protein
MPAWTAARARNDRQRSVLVSLCISGALEGGSVGQYPQWVLQVTENESLGICSMRYLPRQGPSIRDISQVLTHSSNV